MVIALFQSKRRPASEANADYGKLSRRLTDIVSHLPGFISVDTFSSGSGEGLVVARFESQEALEAWWRHADHRAAQERREDFYEAYSVHVCEVVRDYAWQSASVEDPARA